MAVLSIAMDPFFPSGFSKPPSRDRIIWSLGIKFQPLESRDLSKEGSLHYTPEHCLVSGGFQLYFAERSNMVQTVAKCILWAPNQGRSISGLQSGLELAWNHRHFALGSVKIGEPFLVFEGMSDIAQSPKRVGSCWFPFQPTSKKGSLKNNAPW